MRCADLKYTNRWPLAELSLCLFGQDKEQRDHQPRRFPRARSQSVPTGLLTSQCLGLLVNSGQELLVISELPHRVGSLIHQEGLGIGVPI